VAVLLLPQRTTAQSGTVTDDAFLSRNATTQKLNLGGQGISLIVAGSIATVGLLPVGTTTTYIKFQLPEINPPSTFEHLSWVGPGRDLQRGIGFDR
jgi:hypothetical protein